MAVSNVRRADDTEYRSPCGAGELAVWADGSESRGSRESHGFPAPLATPVRPTTPPSRPPTTPSVPCRAPPQPRWNAPPLSRCDKGHRRTSQKSRRARLLGENERERHGARADAGAPVPADVVCPTSVRPGERDESVVALFVRDGGSKGSWGIRQRWRSV
ncbi:hypothetical protein GTW59_38405 [Streptomyces sp. SID89]|nr:hypothetical protein [Streptomyces sp. SID89]